MGSSAAVTLVLFSIGITLEVVAVLILLVKAFGGRAGGIEAGLPPGWRIVEAGACGVRLFGPDEGLDFPDEMAAAEHAWLRHGQALAFWQAGAASPSLVRR